MSINPFTKRSIKKSSPVYKDLSDAGFIENEYKKTSLNEIYIPKKISLKEHQLKIVNHFKKNRGLIAVHGLGSGKTITAIASTLDYLKEDPQRIVIVISPASLESNFKKEMEIFISEEDKEIFEKFFIMSYEKFSFNYKKYENLKNFFLIIDEAHNLRTKISKETGTRAKRILSLSKNADKVLLLTATPFYNEPYDIVNLVALANKSRVLLQKKFFYDKLNSENNSSFFKYYFSDIISYYNPNNLLLQKYYPTHKVNEVFLKMQDIYLRIYKELEKNTDIGNSYYRNPNLFFNGLRQASNKLDDSLYSPKLQWVKNFIELHPNEKTLIYTNWVKAGINGLIKFVPTDKILILEGSTPKSERKDIVDIYNTDKDKNILIISKAGGEGIDLKNTRNVIILDPSWNNSVDSQVIGRAIRFMSHSDLPPEERHVNIFQLFLLKPNEHNNMINSSGYRYENSELRLTSEERWSVDLYLRCISKEKDKYLKDFIKKNIIPYSI